MITFDAVSVGTGNRTILHPFSLSMSEPLVSVIGANGSGKSTFARLINGLILPSSGTVFVETTTDADSTKLNTAHHGAEVRRRVGFVFTDANAQLIMPTAVEDIALSLRKSHRNRKQRDLAAREHLSQVGLQDHADQSVHALSGGQKQLLALTSVLATQPEILVADEPTTLLDLRNARQISDRLCELSQQTIIITHDLELAARADRTLVIDEGYIVFDGEAHAAIEHYKHEVCAL